MAVCLLSIVAVSVTDTLGAQSQTPSSKVVLANDIVLVAIFTFLMIISAYIRIPLFFTPVPVTLQTFVLFLSIGFLKNKASLSQGLYIFLGAVGLPVFSKGGAGLLYLLGPTGGYLLGFLIAALVLPFLLPKKPSFIKMFSIFFLGGLIYFSLGVIWLINLHRLSPGAAFTAGVLPFIIGDILKMVLASFICLKRR